MVVTVTKKVTIEQDVELFQCSHCKIHHRTLKEAEECEKKDLIQMEKERKLREKRELEYSKKVDRVLEDMPKLPEEEYAKLAINVALTYAGSIIPCLGCGHPRMEGYECINPDCPGLSEDAEDIDSEELFYDDQFQLPEDFQVILYPEKKP